MDDTSSDTKTSDIQTSQAKTGGWSLTEGSSGGSSAGPNLYGSEMAPTGLSTETSMSQENQFKTSQQIKGEHALTEGA